MLLVNSDTSNNVALYNAFKSYIDKYITISQNEEYIRNYSYKHICVLKLYAAFNLVKRIYDLSLLTDKDNNLLHTIPELFSTYSIRTIGAELQKINININDILDIFFNETVTQDLYSYKNKYNSISKLNKLIINPEITSTMTEESTTVDIYKGTTRTLSILAGYDDQPKPVIQNEWKNFSLYIRQGTTNIVEYWWDVNSTPKSNTYPATLSNIAGEIIFTITPTILDLLPVGLYTLRLFFTQNDDQTDIFEQVDVLNILQ